jgi:pSer/pThr/pTyr-binding forkhead associated (FHA) protein
MNVKLVMFRDDGSRRHFSLRPGTTTIGRKDDCGIRIPLAAISRRHAEIFVDDDGVVLKDLGAANGTYLNNMRVTEEDLEPGDQIAIGSVVFTVQIEGQPSDDEIVPIPVKATAARASAGKGPSVGTSPHVHMTDEESDPIAALEALASSGDQTAIQPDEDDDEI